MYIDAETVIELAKVLGALSTIAGAVITVYKFFDRLKKQETKIQKIQEEQTMICYGIMACLKGLQEQGCNGPVTEALGKLSKHLNLAAHDLEG